MASKKMRPGSLALQCGVILLAMGIASLASDRHLIEGPTDEQLVPVQARLLSAECEVKRIGSPGGAQSSVHGEPVVRYEYALGGQIHQGSRYQRQRNSAVGSMSECRQLVDKLRSQSFVQAWVDPANPEFAILDKRLRDESLAKVFAGLGGALALLGTWRLLRHRAS